MDSSSSSSEELHDVDWEEFVSFSNYEDPFVLSPQFRAVVENDVDHLRQLIKEGKSVNINDNLGNTPLHVAIIKDKGKIFDYLISLKATRLDAANFEGFTPLMMAVDHSREEFALKLIQKSIDLNFRNNNEDTALLLSIGKCFKVTCELIERGADINSQNCMGETPLFRSCHLGLDDYINLLIYHGADPTICDRTGNIPFTKVFDKCSYETQKFVFDCTFGNEKIDISLYTYTTALINKSDLFYKLLPVTSDIYYTDTNLHFFCQSMPQMSGAMFKLFFDKFPQVAREFFSRHNPMLAFENHINTANAEDICESILILCDSQYMEYILEKCRYRIPKFVAKVSEDSLIKVVCCLLSYGFDLYREDLDYVYGEYGYGPLFKILQHMPLKDYDTVEEQFIIPKIFYDIRVDLNSCYKNNFNERLLRPTFVEIAKKLFKIEGHVKSLLEISRNEGRNYIIDKYQIKNNIQFYGIIRWLQLPNIAKELLTLEKFIYSYD